MNGNVAWLLEVRIREGRGDDFPGLMAEMVGAAKANEPGTLAYEWNVSEDGTVCHIYERYADSAAVMIHAATFGETFARRFLGVLQPVRMVVYGSPDADVKAAIAGFDPVYLAPAGGFSR